MNYPLISEYIETIKSTEDNFDELTYLRPVLGDDGEPMMTSGNFAVVFKMEDVQTGKLYALKCFTKEQEGREEAYKQIAEELEGVDSPYIVPIKYLEKELFVDTDQTDETEFPVLLMDWVEGQTLDKYLRENLDDKYALEMLAYRFSQLAQWLIPQPFAHGDLKPDNILVRDDGTLVLVDYDGMYVPAMGWQEARELGSPDFRHPLRTENDFDEHIDDFPIISILLSLKAISLDSSLLQEYGASDRLLFSEKDYVDIGKSNAIAVLLDRYPEKEIQRILGIMLIAALTQKLGKPFILNRPINRDSVYYEVLSDRFYNNEEAVFNNLIWLSAQRVEDVTWKIGWCYENGYGVRQSIEAAKEYYLKSAQRGDCMGQRLLGLWYYHHSNDWTEADKWLIAAGNQGDSDAICDRGWLYHNIWSNQCILLDDDEDPNDLESIQESVRLYTKSAESGNSRAQYELGQMYLYGDGVPQDFEIATKWYLKSAMSRNEHAQYQLGLCFEKGMGVERDYKKAFFWYMKSAHSHGGYNSPYHYNLAQCYQTGRICDVNYSLAVFWYKECIDSCEGDYYYHSLWCLGYCYENGFGIEKNHEKALKYFLEYMDYCIDSGVYYSIEEDLYEEKALTLWRMGYCCEKGYGIDKNVEKAKKFYKKASLMGIQEAGDALVRLMAANE